MSAIIIIATLTKSKQLPFPEYQISDLKQKKLEFREPFQMGPNLKNFLCKNKDKLIPVSSPGVYELKCSCGLLYNGETKRKIISRSIEHQQESIKGN